jgi:hypothetical protein
MKQSTVIHLLLCVAVLPAIALFYLLLAPPDQSGLLSSQWVLFAAFALALMLATFAPSLLRRWRGFPPPRSLSPSDIGFCVLVTVVGCALAVVGVFTGMWWMMVLGIMLAPLSFMFRKPRAPRDEQTS